jgi:uncharacterized phage protein gp47/JayE
MPTLASKKFSTIVGDFAAATQGACSTLIDFTTGSILRSVAEASAAVTLWLQGMAFQVLSAARLSTSVGTDVDTWMADYMPNAPGSTTPRLPSRVALGTLTFSRFTATQSTLIPIGAQASTADLSAIFVVVADQGNFSYRADVNAYLVPTGVTTIDVPVQALVPGTASNVQQGTVTLLRSTIPGIDAVTNSASMSQGLDAETDAQAKARVPLYFQSLARATEQAIGYAISTVQQGLNYSIIENRQYSGQADIGYITIVIDDGSGAPTTSLIQSVSAAVDLYRAQGTRFGVFPPTQIGATISFTLTVTTGYDRNTILGIASSAVTAYVKGLILAQPLRWSKLEQIIYESHAAIINVTSLLLNGSQNDIVTDGRQRVVLNSVTVN